MFSPRRRQLTTVMVPVLVPVPNAALASGTKGMGNGPDLSVGGDAFKGVAIQTPDGMSTQKIDNGLIVSNGATASFQLEIKPGATNILERKNTVESSDVNKIEKFAIDEPQALVYETSLGGINQWHFVGNVKVDNKDFTCEDVHGPSYTQEDINAMWTACSSMKAAPPSPGSSADSMGTGNDLNGSMNSNGSLNRNDSMNSNGSTNSNNSMNSTGSNNPNNSGNSNSTTPEREPCQDPRRPRFPSISFHVLPGLRAQSLRSRGVGEESRDRFAQWVQLIGFDEDRVVVVAKDLLHRWKAGRHDRPAGGHVLEELHRRGVLAGRRASVGDEELRGVRHDEHVGGEQPRGQLAEGR